METSHSKEFYQSKIEELNQKRDELEELILRYNDMRGKVRTSFGGDEARKMEDMIDDQINLLESTLKDWRVAKTDIFSRKNNIAKNLRRPK